MTAELVTVHSRASMPDKLAYAHELAQSGLLPAAYRKQPSNLLWAVEYGEMLSLSPMAAVTGIHVIEGKPTASAALISALVRRAGHRLRVTGDGERAVAEIVRFDDPDFTFRSEWTTARAQTAGLLGKDVWKKYRPAMLKARAVTEVARDACEEALMGMHHTPEELGAEVDEDGIPVRRSPMAGAAGVGGQAPAGPPPGGSATEEPDWDELLPRYEEAKDRQGLINLFKWATHLRPDDTELAGRIRAAGERVRAAAVAAPSDGDVVDGEVVDDDAAAVPEQASGAVNTSRGRQMFALLNEAGLGGNAAEPRARRLKFFGNVLGKQVESSKELTAGDVEQVVGALQRYQREGDLDTVEARAQEDAALAAMEDERDSAEGGDQA